MSIATIIAVAAIMVAFGLVSAGLDVRAHAYRYSITGIATLSRDEARG